METRLEEMNSDLEQFESRVQSLDSKGRQEHIEILVELDERRDDVHRTLEVVKRSGEVSWKLHRGGAERAMTALIAGMADAKERLESRLLNA